MYTCARGLSLCCSLSLSPSLYRYEYVFIDVCIYTDIHTPLRRAFATCAPKPPEFQRQQAGLQLPGPQKYINNPFGSCCSCRAMTLHTCGPGLNLGPNTSTCWVLRPSGRFSRLLEHAARDRQASCAGSPGRAMMGFSHLDPQRIPKHGLYPKMNGIC